MTTFRIAALCGTLAALAVPAAASAATLYVSQTASGGNNKSCATAGYSTVQSAVDASKNGGKVYICGTTPYDESVTIQDKGVDLTGDPGATLTTSDNSDDYVLGIFGKGTVHVTGLTIADAPFFGIDVEDGANADIMDTSVVRYADVGIFALGAKTKLKVESSTIDGAGPNGDPFARTGIYLLDDVSAEILKNAISNNATTDPDATVGSGIQVAGGCDGFPLTTGANIHHNTFTNNDDGVALDNKAVDDSCNGAASPAPLTKTANKVHHNVIVKNNGYTNHTQFTDQYGDTYDGYQAGISDSGNGDEINDNQISGNGYGPLTTPGGPFAVPIDIQSTPTTNPKVKNNTFNGSPTTPPY